MRETTPPKPFDLPRYLSRVGLEAPPDPDAAGLRRILVAQLGALCFENLDPLLGRVPDVSPQAVFDKIVHGGRGGYCFELNTLLEGALRATGFAPQRVLARVRDAAGKSGARSHLALLVTLEGETWLADAGFGGPGPLGPLRLHAPGVQEVPNGRYRLRDQPETGERVLWREGRAGWVPLYGFDRAHVGGADIAAANHLCATWERAPFSAHLMLNGYDGDTRIGVFDGAVTLQRAGWEEKRELADFEAFHALLTTRLGLHAPQEMLRAAWEKIAPWAGLLADGR
jgi:N-hydroxyarylamine O-acetyltransferase